jgi:MarR family transcriptional regulator for hemolysin
MDAMAHKKRTLAFDFEQSPGYWVCRTAHAFEAALAAELEGTGTTVRQVQVLATLAVEGDLAQTDIADRLRLEHSTVVRLLDRMERDGWITRRGSTKDRRRKVISPTRKSIAKWAEIVERGERIRRRAGHGLGPARMRTLRDLLARVRVNLGAES